MPKWKSETSSTVSISNPADSVNTFSQNSSENSPIERKQGNSRYIRPTKIEMGSSDSSSQRRKISDRNSSNDSNSVIRVSEIFDFVKKNNELFEKISDKYSGNKKGSTQFMHYLYTPISINGAPFIAKLAIEEYDLTGKKRAYNLQRIKLLEVSRAQYSQLIEENREKYAYTSNALSVAQLFDFVKKKDKNFTPRTSLPNLSILPS